MMWITAAACFSYVLARAVLLDVVFDEAWTIGSFAPMHVTDIVSYRENACANNHMLNTLLIKYFQRVLGDGLFAARLPNVLAFGLYIYFSYRICRYLASDLARACLFILLLVNPFVLEFFSLARGYGLGLGFMMPAVFYALRHSEEHKRRHLYISLSWGALSVFSNFSFLNVWLGLLFVLHLALLLSHASKAEKIRTLSGSILITAVFALALYFPITRLIRSGTLYYGGYSDFYNDTLTSLTAYTLQSPFGISEAKIVLNIVLIAAGMIILSALGRVNNIRKALGSKKILFFFLLIVPALSTITQFYLRGTPYLADRTALFFYPLLVMFLVFCSEHARKASRYARLIAAGLALACTVNFILHANITRTTVWPFNAHAQEILSMLDKEGRQKNRQITLGSQWTMLGIPYYLSKGTYPNVIHSNELTEAGALPDYYLFLNFTPDKVTLDVRNHYIHKLSKKVVLSFPDEGLILYTGLKRLNASPADSLAAR